MEKLCSKETNSAPLVSLVVPCYNYAHFLGQCVNSVLAQDFENFEVLIMDNCSPDNTPEVASSFEDRRVRYFRNDTNIGAVRNFNKGVALARGKYVWVLSADDLLRSNSVLSRYVEVMEKDASLGFVFCRAIEIQGEKEGGIFPWADCGEQDRVWHDSSFFLRLLDSCCVVLSSVMMRKESLERVGLFPVDLPYSDDWYVLNMLALHCGAAYCADPMVYCRFHPASLTSQQSREFARICAADGLVVLWRVGQKAELAQQPGLRKASIEALVRLARRYLMAGVWGAGPRINATELEEILKTRIGEGTDIQRISNDVYTGLADDLKSLYHVHDAPIDPSDEVSAYWDLWCHAERANAQPLTEACKLVLAHRLAHRLQDGSLGASSDEGAAELDELLRSRIRVEAAVKHLRALVYRDLAEQQFTQGEYSRATQSYRLALAARPGHPGTSAKYLLMRMGAPGIWIRQMSHQVRAFSRRS